MAELPVADEAERERIRRGLLRYKEMHRIGDPELCERMKYLGIIVGRRTLHRFITGVGRTEDKRVRRCAKFLSEVAPPPVEDSLGASLAKFLGARLEEKGWSDRYAGTYRSFMRPYAPEASAQAGVAPAAEGKRGAASRSGETHGFKAQCSILRLEQASDPTFLRATETLYVDGKPPPDHERRFGEQPWLGNTGVFIPVGLRHYLLMVRSVTDVRIYDLRKLSNDPLVLHGYALQPESGFILRTMPLIGGGSDGPVREIIFVPKGTGGTPAVEEPVSSI